MKRRIISILLILIMVFSLAGCGGAGQKEQVATRTVTDCMDRTVEIPADPQRVAVMFASNAHMMAMLDVGDKLVGAPKGVKMDLLMQMKYPEIVDMATPYQEGSINVEELLNINADLVIVRYSTGRNDGEVEKLEKLGIPYVVVDYMNIEEIDEAIMLMGQIFDKQEKAQKYVDFCNDTIDLVQDRVGDIPESEWPSVYHSVNEAIRTDGEGDICPVIMNLAAVKNVAVENGVKAGNDGTYTTLEEIYEWDPDAFICNEYSVTDYIYADTKWAGLTAVQNKAIYTLPVGATRWCHPGSIEAHMGVLSIAYQFYPERFSDFDYKAYIKDYYKDCFALDLEDEMVDQIISGVGMRKSNEPVR